MSGAEFPSAGFWPRFKLPVALATLALVVGAVAFALTRDREPPKAAAPVAPAPTAAPEQPAPEVPLDALPVQTPPAASAEQASPTQDEAAPSEPTEAAAPAEARTATRRLPPAPPSTGSARKKGSWRQDPGF